MKINERLTVLFQQVKQKEISEKLKISQSSVSDLLKGKTDPSLSTLQGICMEFNVDANWLLLGKETDFLTDDEKKLIKGYRGCSDKEKGRIEEIIDSSEGNKKPYDKAGNL